MRLEWTRWIETAALVLGLSIGVTSETRAGTSSVGRVTIQVRNEPGYSAQEVAHLLADPAYLGSVVAGAAPIQDMTNGASGEAAFVFAEFPTTEIVTITVHSANEQRTRFVLDALIANLKTILPGERQKLQQELELGEQRFAEATREFQASDDRLKALIASKDGGDTGGMRAQVSNWLASAQQEQQQALMNLAKSQAIHDYLVEVIAREPKGSPNGVVEGDGAEVAQLQSEIKRAEDELAAVTAKFQPTHPQVRAASQALDDLNKALAAKQDAAAANRRSRRSELERELFNNDRDLALMKARMVTLGDSIERYQKQARDLMLRDVAWESASSERRRAEELLDRARKELDNSKSRVQRFTVGPWLQVIAGPTIESARDV